MHKFHRPFSLIEGFFRTFPDFTKMCTRWKFERICLKIIHQKGLFDAIKENPNFPNCRRILHIYRQWLLIFPYNLSPKSHNANSRKPTNLEVRYLIQVTENLISKNWEINRFCAELRVHKHLSSFYYNVICFASVF